LSQIASEFKILVPECRLVTALSYFNFISTLFLLLIRKYEFNYRRQKMFDNKYMRVCRDKKKIKKYA